MSQYKYDVAVAYRIYPKVSNSCGTRPPIFCDDKLKLSEFCLKSFRNSLGGLRVKLWALLNGCPPEYEAMFQRNWPQEDLVLVRFSGVGAGTTLHEAHRILREQTDAEIVYIGADDYFFLPGQFPLAVDFFGQYLDADFIAPYESHDLYTIDLHNMRFENREFCGKKWFACISTTDTFMARRSVLIECQSVIDRLARDHKGRTLPDLALWAALTKKRVFNPFKFVRWSLTHRWFWAGSMVLSWYYCWRQILFGRRYKLWSPHTAIATHMVAGLESPGVDWQNEFQKQLAGIQPETAKP